MEQQNDDEMKMLKTFFAEHGLEVVYGLKKELAVPLSKLLTGIYDKLMENFDYKRVKQLHYSCEHPLHHKDTRTHKIIFTIGLMHKKTMSYPQKEYAINRVIEELGDCTIVDCIGSFKGTQMRTFQVTKFIEGEIPRNFVHDKAKELKRIFFQESVITEVYDSYQIDFNEYSKEYEKEIENLMSEYDFSWNEAVLAYKSGLY
ncbi:MAG: hypothetical protein E7Z91_07095 [Cyanobacteria bacterium SIG30]|nr:hypothetical protein [Cyanobacteria bacterium SIG30]